MTPIELTLLAMVAVLIGFLVYRSWQRTRSPVIQERQWSGHGFDPGLLTSRIQKLRADYVSAVRSHRGAPGYHCELIARTRRMVVHLEFFRTRGSVPETPAAILREIQSPPHSFE